MPTLLQDETLNDLKVRHCDLVKEALKLMNPQFSFHIRLLNQLAGVQVDLLRFHSQDELAMRLNTQLARLADMPPKQDELLRHLLNLLCPAN